LIGDDLDTLTPPALPQGLTENPMPTFPLPFRPKQDYHKSDGHHRYYGARRDGGRRMHAACDLIAPKGTQICAVEDGEVISYSDNFYHGTGAVAFKLKASGRIVRYCEIDIKGLAPGVHVGSKLKEGDPIAFVGKMFRDSMLHFELYEGTAHGSLSNGTMPYHRRKDLIDPTEYLDNCTVRNVLTAHHDAPAATPHAATHHKSHGHHKAHHHKSAALPVRWIR
jgi:murein DD-endopeptidase MepM/ murein hydrolase activator NlpD